VGIARVFAGLLAIAGCGRLGFAPESSSTPDAVTASTDEQSPLDDAQTGDATDSAVTSGWAQSSPVFPSGSNLYAVWAFAANNIWVAGDNGETLQFDGTNWVDHSEPVQDVNNLWGLAANDLWEVGALCEVRRWNGSTWVPTTLANCGNASLFAVQGAAANDVWLAGVAGAVFHYVGGSFTLVSQANNIDLWSIWAAATNDVYIVGTRGTVLHWTGTAFEDESLAVNVTLASVWGANANDVWAVGSGGAIFRKQNGGLWVAQQSPTTRFLYAVWGTSATDVWIVGDLGAALHFDGTTWQQVTMPTTLPLRAIATVPGDGIRAVGHVGTVLEHP
jgi:hypothetical protein